MKILNITILLFLIFAQVCRADFDKGIEFYWNSEYDSAISEFLKTEKKNIVSLLQYSELLL